MSAPFYLRLRTYYCLKGDFRSTTLTQLQDEDFFAIQLKGEKSLILHLTTSLGQKAAAELWPELSLSLLTG